MILVVGGSGLLGSMVTRRLLAHGKAVRVMTRSPERAGALRDAGAQIVAGDLLDRASLDKACAGVERILAAAHSIFGRGRYASEHVDGSGHKELIEAAKSRGVRTFVYTSAHLPAPGYQRVPFFRIKQEVERFLAGSGLDVTILRPTAFMEFHAHLLIGEPILANKRVVIFGPGEQPRNFVAAEEVASLAVDALTGNAFAGETVEVGGPEDLTDIQVVRTYEKLSGKRAKVTHLPVGIARMVSTAIGPIHPGLSQVLQAAALGSSAEQEFASRTASTRRLLTRTRLEDWARRRICDTSAASKD